MNSGILSRDDLPNLSYVSYKPENINNLPTVVFLHGLKSDKEGTKALYLEKQCKKRNQPFIRFDFSGHGKSEGIYQDCNISTWVNDAKDIINNLVEGKVVLVGSSMGGWVSLIVARDMKEKISALIGIAAAPDFTEEIYNDKFNEAQRKEIKEKGIIKIASEYSDEPYIFTYDFIIDGKKNLLLDKKLDINIPVRIIQGKKDSDVPWEKANKIYKIISSNDKKIIFIEDGDHRLSKVEELKIIDENIKEVSRL